MFRKLTKLLRNKRSASQHARENDDSRCGDNTYGYNTPDDVCTPVKHCMRVHGAVEVTTVAALEMSTCLSGSKNGDLAICRICPNLGRQSMHKWSRHEKEVTKVAYSGDSRELFASASRDKTICVWRRSGDYGVEATLQCCYLGHDQVVSGVALDPSGVQMISGSRDNTVRLWDVATGQCVRTTALAQNVVTDVCWQHTPSSYMVAQSSEDKTVRLWDTRTLHVVATTAPKQHIQTCCAFSHTSDRLCMSASNGFGSRGCEATLWDFRSSAGPVVEFPGHLETVNGCCFVPSHTQFIAATCSNDGTVRIWDCDSGKCSASVHIPASGPLTSVTASSSCNLYVASFFAGIQSLHVQQASTGETHLSHALSF